MIWGMLLDTHCHLDLFENPDQVAEAAETASIHTIAVTNAPSVFPKTVALALGRRFVRPAIGLHPELAIQRAGELPLFHEHLSTTRYVGEVGLDYVMATSEDRRRQRRVFEEVVTACRRMGGKVLTLHSRRAEADVVDCIGNDFPGTWILHWYSGSKTALGRALVQGALFSANAAMMRSDKALAILAQVPRERVLLESDGPFVQVDGRASTPRSVAALVPALATLWGVAQEEAEAQLSSNARTVLA